MADTIVVIVLAIVVFVLTVFATRDFIRSMHRDSTIEELKEKWKDISDPPWTLTGYFERMIRVSEKLAKDKEMRKYEPIVLWLTLNGLQINEDGSYEWIKKENPYVKTVHEIEEKEKKRDELVDQLRKTYYTPGSGSYYYPPAQSVLFADNQPFVFTPMSDICQADKESLLRMQLNQLQSQYTNLQTQLMNEAQTNIIISNLRRY